MGFNEAQKKAINHIDGPMMVLAGPGSGKTTVITHRVRQLIEKAGVSPANILVVTFTKAAATEMKERFKTLVGGQNLPVSFGTFHAIFFSILKHAYKYDNKNVLSADKKRLIFQEIIESSRLEIDDEAEFIESIENEISLIKGERLSLDNYYAATCGADIFKSIYTQYQQLLREQNLLDFDDMMLYTYELFDKRADILEAWQKKFQYILIDEFQDVNRIQYEIIRMLAAPKNNLFIVGDDDQSIYHFRGARPDIMLNFPKDYPSAKTVVMDINYRCSRNIAQIAGRVIKNNRVRFQKQMRSACGDGSKVEMKAFKTPLEECRMLISEIKRLHETEGLPFKEIAVLYRTNTGARMLVSQLLSYNIPFKMKDRLPNMYEHWIMHNIMSYVHIAGGGRERRDYLQIINRPNRYVSRQAFDAPKVDFEKVKAFYEDKEWMLERLETFEEDLHMLDTMPPYAALNYLRQGIGYEQFLYDYAMEHKLKPDELIDIYDNIQESAKSYRTWDEWFAYIEGYTKRLKAQEMNPRRFTDDSVVLSTMHSAKGLEYDAVFIIDVNEGIIPYKKAVLDEEIEEERRMLYVAMTRARKNLNIYFVRERHGKVMEMSRFGSEILNQQKP